MLQLLLTLVLSPSAHAGKVGYIGGLLSSESAAITGAGHTAVPITTTQWRTESTSFFQTFDVIFMGDQGCAGPGSSVLTELNNAKTRWAPAVTGRIVVHTTDPGCHARTQFIQNAIAWASGGTGTGLVVTSD